MKFIAAALLVFAAVVLIETHRGWEGPPNTTQIKVIGANLTNGFR